jgi:hypothetical protein
MLGPIGGTLEIAGRGVHSTKVTTVVVLGQTVLANVVVTVAVSMVYLQIARAVVSLCGQASSRSLGGKDYSLTYITSCVALYDS